jgi:hypothetical protein
MKDLVAEGLERRVIFLGFRSDVPAILRAVDVAVQPSLSENLGGTTEAMLMECPVVATRIGGMIDNVVDGETGVLVNPSDPPSLAAGILRLLHDRDTARRYGVAGSRRVSGRVTLRRTVDGLAALYHDQSGAQPRGYRPAVSAGRFVVGSALCALIMLRYMNPFWIGSVRSTLVGLRSTLRFWIGSVRRRFIVGPARSVLIRLRNMHLLVAGRVQMALHKLRHTQFASSMPRMWLYRFYAFVGRLPPLSFGIRRRIRSMLRSLSASANE